LTIFPGQRWASADWVVLGENDFQDFTKALPRKNENKKISGAIFSAPTTCVKNGPFWTASA
jgi:hypothetical protein